MLGTLYRTQAIAVRTIPVGYRCDNRIVAAVMAFTPSDAVLFIELKCRYRQRTIHFFGDEFNLVSGFDLVQHRRIFDAKYHRHAGHIEIGQRAMFDGDFTAVLDYFFDGAARQCCGSRSVCTDRRAAVFGCRRHKRQLLPGRHGPV